MKGEGVNFFTILFVCLCLLTLASYLLLLLVSVHLGASHRGWSPKWWYPRSAPEHLFPPADTVQAYGLRVVTQGSPLLSTELSKPTHHLSFLFVRFALISMGSLCFTIMEPQIMALKTLPVKHGPKIKTHDLDQFWEEANIWPYG